MDAKNCLSASEMQKLSKEAQYYYDMWKKYDVLCKCTELSKKEKLKAQQGLQMYKFIFSGISKSIEIIGLEWHLEFDPSGNPSKIVLSSKIN